MKQKSRSLRFNVAFYFFLLIGILLLVIWLFETFLITPYYEARSKSNLKNRASSYYNEYIMNNSKIDEISREAIMDNIHIYIATFETNERGETHLVPKNGEAIGRFSFDFNERELLEEYNSTNTMYSDSKFDLYMYIKDIDGTNDLFIASTRITPITATKMIITEQLIFITIFAIVIGVIFTFIASRSLSNPLEILTNEAKELSNGNYDVEFSNKGYKEVVLLSNTLSNAEVEIKRSDEYRRSITANVTHDLKTPLTIIKSYAEMIKDLYGDNEAKRNEALDIIINESERLSDLVNDVLMLSKLESGSMNVELEEINLSSVLNDCLLRFDVMKKDGYTINTNIDSDIIVDADNKKMNAVFYNLIGNAINYSGEDKTIDVSLLKENDYVIFKVTNYGSIIDVDKQQKIWDEYYRDENSHKRNTVGTGLGLSIVKNVFELHNLEYGVTSNEADGTTFYFKIKLKAID